MTTTATDELTTATEAVDSAVEEFNTARQELDRLDAEQDRRVTSSSKFIADKAAATQRLTETADKLQTVRAHLAVVKEQHAEQLRADYEANLPRWQADANALAVEGDQLLRRLDEIGQELIHLATLEYQHRVAATPPDQNPGKGPDAKRGRLHAAVVSALQPSLGRRAGLPAMPLGRTLADEFPPPEDA